MGELTLWVCCGATVVLSAAVLITGVVSTMKRADRELASLRDAAIPKREQRRASEAMARRQA